MDSWTNIHLPKIGVSRFSAATRSLRIDKWVRVNNLNRSEIKILNRVVKFKNEADAIFFQLTFTMDR